MKIEIRSLVSIIIDMNKLLSTIFFQQELVEIISHKAKEKVRTEKLLQGTEHTSWRIWLRGKSPDPKEKGNKSPTKECSTWALNLGAEEKQLIEGKRLLEGNELNIQKFKVPGDELHSKTCFSGTKKVPEREPEEKGEQLSR